MSYRLHSLEIPYTKTMRKIKAKWFGLRMSPPLLPISPPTDLYRSQEREEWA
jgi:hypothetical protein